MTEKEFVEKLVNIRKSKKITQAEVSKLSGLTQQQVSSLERMERSPNLRNLLRYCGGIGASLEIVEKECVMETPYDDGIETDIEKLLGIIEKRK